MPMVKCEKMLLLEGSDLVEVLGCRTQREGCQRPENLPPRKVLVKKRMCSTDKLVPR